MAAFPREILAMLSVQTPGGLVFGTARRIQGQTIGFEADGRMEPGDEVQWRMELPGLDETAMGSMRIMGGQKDANATVMSWTGAITSVSREDAEVFEVWRQGVESGTRAFSYSTKPPTDSWLAATTMAGSTEAERRLALAAEEERKKGRVERAKRLAKNAKMWPDHEDRVGGKSVASGAFRAALSGSVSRSHGSVSPLSSVSGANGGPRPRDQVAAALRAPIAAPHKPAQAFSPAPKPPPATTTAEPVVVSAAPPAAPQAEVASPPLAPAAPAAPRSPAPSAVTTLSSRPAVATPAPAPNPAPGVAAARPPADPNAFTKVAPTSPARSSAAAVYVDGSMVSVSFTDPAGWAAVRGAVLAGRLAVPAASAPLAGTTVSIWLRLPSGVTLAMTGQAVAAAPGQLVVNLNLTVPQRQSLEFG